MLRFEGVVQYVDPAHPDPSALSALTQLGTPSYKVVHTLLSE